MSQSLPTFTVVIPSRDRPLQLARCLSSLAQLDYPRDLLSIIVVDDGSEPSIDAAIRPFLTRLPFRLFVQQGAGPAAARNRGAAAAQSRFVAFTDDDCRPSSDWLRLLALSLTQFPERAVGGRTINGLPSDRYSTASQLLISFLYSYYNPHREDARFLTTNNLAVPRDKFIEIGGFDTRFLRAAAEDRELCDRWLQRGWKLSYVPEAVVYHEHAMTLRGFCKQHWTYGQGAWRYRLARAERERKPVRVVPLRFYARLLARPFREGYPVPVAAKVAGLLLLSQVANAGGFFTERVLYGRRSTPAAEGDL